MSLCQLHEFQSLNIQNKKGKHTEVLGRRLTTPSAACNYWMRDANLSIVFITFTALHPHPKLKIVSFLFPIGTTKLGFSANKIFLS